MHFVKAPSSVRNTKVDVENDMLVSVDENIFPARRRNLSGEPKANPDKFRSRTAYIFSFMVLIYCSTYTAAVGLFFYYNLQSCKFDRFVMGVK